MIRFSYIHVFRPSKSMKKLKTNPFEGAEGKKL